MTTVVERKPEPRAKPARKASRPIEVSFTSVVTSTIWMGCIAIGVIGIIIPYARPQPAKPQPTPIQAELLDVSLTADPIPLEAAAPATPDVLVPPPSNAPLTPPSAPALIPVAAPNPAIAFELPVVGPTRVVEASQASYSTPTTTPADNPTAQPSTTPLTFGLGEGKQPAPTYPARAASEGQEGTVRIEFTIGTDGRVVAAEITSASPWPLLNQAALKVIRERWRFKPGPVRRHTIPLEFSLRKKI
jgi:protein TonB